MDTASEAFIKDAVERQLNKLPEVQWDRWTGDLEELGVFGWVPRDDGRSDFVLVRFDHGDPWFFSTSSARYSHGFAKRLGFDGVNHQPCKRVEDFFHVQNSVHIKKTETKHTSSCSPNSKPC